MTIALAILLFLNALFNVVAWPAFFRRVLKDPRARAADGSATTFLRVHAILVGIALLLALASVVLGVVAVAASR